MDKLHELSVDIYKWQESTFPGGTAKARMEHLGEEVNEVIVELDGNNAESLLEEFADCFILLSGTIVAAGFTMEDIYAAMEKKLAINKTRKWGKPNDQGVAKHI